MKKRRNLIIALLLVAALALGIGYATVSTVTLNIDGRAEVKVAQENFVVKFDATEGKTTYDETVANASVASDLMATINVFGLKAKDQFTTVKYTIVNDTTSLYDAQINNILINEGNTAEFRVDIENIEELEDLVLQPGEEVEVIVVVTLKKSLIEDANTAIDITIDATPLEITE